MADNVVVLHGSKSTIPIDICQTDLTPAPLNYSRMTQKADSFGKLGALIQSNRKERGLSVRQLGKKVGVSGATIHNWERGKVGTMNTANVGALAAELGVPRDIILGFLTEEGQRQGREAAADVEMARHHVELVRQYLQLSPEVRAIIRQLIETLAAANIQSDSPRLKESEISPSHPQPFVRQRDESREPREPSPKERKIRR